MKKRIWSKAVSIFTAILLVVGIVPNTTITALAAVGAPSQLYVGNKQVISGSDNATYWTTDTDGNLTQSAADQSWNVKYDPATVTLTLRGATIQGGTNTGPAPFGSGIYAQCSIGQSVTLTIKLIGENTITGYYGIYVNAEISADSNGTDASLTITGENNGSLEVSGSNHGIFVKSGTGNASVTIENASVDAKTTQTNSGYAGVYVHSSAIATNSPQLSLAVNGGSLTTSASEGNDGIQFYVGAYEATSATTSLTVNDNAIVDARTGGISASGVSVNPNVDIGSTDSTSGIVFDGSTGTVYGDVTLYESLTINQGETLTIPEGSTLNSNGNLTNKGTILASGGTLEGTLSNGTTPNITEQPYDYTVTEGEDATFTVEASAGSETPTYQWQQSTDNGSSWTNIESETNASYTINSTNTSMNGYQYRCVVTGSGGVSVISQTATLTVQAKPASVPVTGVKLNKDSLTLQEKGSDTLTATVEPADATNQDVIWKSSDTSIATVSADGTVTAISAGTATITATAKDGSGVSASCTLTVTHGKMVQTPKKDATCTVDGTEEYWMCEICGKHFEDESGTILTTPEENKIQATGHSYGEPVWNWSEDGKTCTVTFTCEKDETHKETPKVIVTSAEKTPGTCTETGVTTYTATVEFNGQTYTDTKDVADIPATGHSYDNGKCTVCGAIASDFKVIITAGANGSWQKGTKDGLTFTSNAAYKYFQKVQVDGKDLDASNYTVKEGSTIVTLKTSYLETLSVGKHTLAIVSETGTATTKFTIKAAAVTDDTQSPQTGDSSNIALWIAVLLAAGTALTGTAVYSRKRKYSK